MIKLDLIKSEQDVQDKTYTCEVSHFWYLDSPIPSLKID